MKRFNNKKILFTREDLKSPRDSHTLLNFNFIINYIIHENLGICLNYLKSLKITWSTLKIIPLETFWKKYNRFLFLKHWLIFLNIYFGLQMLIFITRKKRVTFTRINFYLVVFKIPLINTRSIFPEQNLDFCC